MRESEIQKQIRLELSKKGCVVFRMQSGVYRGLHSESIVTVGVAGMSDLQVIIPGGKVAWIETKRPGGKVSDEQNQFIIAMRQMGCLAGVAYSVDDALKIINA